MLIIANVDEVDKVDVQIRSAIALTTLLFVLGLMYFGKLLPEGSAGSDSSNPHDGVECLNCHSFGSGSDERADSSRHVGMCESCHLSRHQNQPFINDLPDANDCARCHSFHRPSVVSIGPDSMSLGFARISRDLCTDCHKDGTSPRVSPGHRVAAGLLHSQRTIETAGSPSEFCLACHDADRSQPRRLEAGMRAPRFHVEASHIFNLVLIPGFRKPNSTLRIQSKIPAAVVTFDGRIECQTCHSLISDKEYLLVQTIDKGLCTTCHDMGARGLSEFAISFK